MFSAACTQHHSKWYLPENVSIPTKKITNFPHYSTNSIVEKLAEEPTKVVKPPVPANVNKWDGEDEDDVKVSAPWTIFHLKFVTFTFIEADVRLCAHVYVRFLTNMQSLFVSIEKRFRFATLDRGGVPNMFYVSMT